MLFRLEMDPKAIEEQRTILGYTWIEVIQVMPWWLKPVVGDNGEDRGTRIEQCYLCRTESGLTWLAAADLDPEIEEGVYREVPLKPAPQAPEGWVRANCYLCTDKITWATLRCAGCGVTLCDYHAKQQPDGRRLCANCWHAEREEGEGCGRCGKDCYQIVDCSACDSATMMRCDRCERPFCDKHLLAGDRQLCVDCDRLERHTAELEKTGDGECADT